MLIQPCKINMFHIELEHTKYSLRIRSTFKPIVIFFILFAVVDNVNCLEFSYSEFNNSVRDSLVFTGESNLALGALQVTTEARGDPIVNFYGRILYKKPVKLWSKRRKQVESFNTTFVINITPQTIPGGEGLAFILVKDPHDIPADSYGQWLGIVNASTNGSSNNNIVAVEFDTKKSYPEDLDDNHVGIDINTIYSVKQTSLKDFGVNISSATDLTAVINYNGDEKELKVFVYNNKDKFPIISMPLDLSLYLSENVYVGFSASTGTSTELNCIKSWSFTGTDVNSSIQKWVWIVTSVSSVILISALSAIGCYIYWRIKRKREVQDSETSFEEEIEISNIGPKKYKFRELKFATENFISRNELGRGGFGIVYKGNLKGKEVAVKRIWKNNQQGRKNMIAEVTTIGSIHHKNVVKLIGWCNESDELLLVYEYMPNGSLDKLLYPEENQQQTFLSWERRHNIVCGVAQSIDYLHNECSRRVLHRDIKTSNIMLDLNFNACLGDFGLARMFNLSEKTHHSTIEIAGTRAYMAPELFHIGKATTETDVYAFGVLTLEVLCGRKPGYQTTDGELTNSIVDWVWELYRMDMICRAIDTKLKENYNMEQAECILLVGLACCHPNPHMRPSIRSVLQVLIGEALPPFVPYEKPAFVWPASIPSLTRELDNSFSGGMLSSVGSFSGR